MAGRDWHSICHVIGLGMLAVLSTTKMLKKKRWYENVDNRHIPRVAIVQVRHHYMRCVICMVFIITQYYQYHAEVILLRNFYLVCSNECLQLDLDIHLFPLLCPQC